MDDRYFAIIPAAFVIFSAIFGVMLLNGKWSKLVPGYNISATDKNAIFFEKIACRYVGKYVLILTVFFALMFVGVIMHILIMAGIVGGLGAVYALFGYIAIINDTRFKRAIYLAKNLEKKPNCLSEDEINKWKDELNFRKKTKS